MECWIGVSDEPERRLIRLAGKLCGAQVPDLAALCAGIPGPRLFIDVSDLLNADTSGIRALRALRRDGATLLSTPEYIRLKLDAAD